MHLKRKQKMNKHIGSSFDDFLTEEGIKEIVDKKALEQVNTKQQVNKPPLTPSEIAYTQQGCVELLKVSLDDDLNTN